MAWAIVVPSILGRIQMEIEEGMSVPRNVTITHTGILHLGKIWLSLLKMLPFAVITRQRVSMSSHIICVWSTLMPVKLNVNTTQDGKTKECLVALEQPKCKESSWTRSNHLGNGRDGFASNYTWTLPYFPSMDEQRCVVRIRYNISTDDYDPYNTTSANNKNTAEGIRSPVEQNPYVSISLGASPLRLAINTAQFGRTFQDRSHAMILRPRPAGLENDKIINLNVRGKRGNIVQTYPAVEYDFYPNDLEMTSSDLVHIQWTGSNTHNNGNPAGDGQAGDAGEGKKGTDRSNIVEMVSRDDNFPLPYESSKMWKAAEVAWIYHGNKNIDSQDLALSMASSGYYQCMSSAVCATQSAERKGNLNNLLDNAPASYEGALLRFLPGVYNYMCTRNNNFSNRSQKGSIIVK